MMWGGRRGGFGGYGRGMGRGGPWMMRRQMMGPRWGMGPGWGGYGYGRGMGYGMGYGGCWPFLMLGILVVFGLVTVTYLRAKG